MYFAPGSQANRSTADMAPATGIVAPSVAIADVTAKRTHKFETQRFTDPARADTDGIVKTSTTDSAPVAPPAITTEELTHIY